MEIMHANFPRAHVCILQQMALSIRCYNCLPSQNFHKASLKHMINSSYQPSKILNQKENLHVVKLNHHVNVFTTIQPISTLIKVFINVSMCMSSKDLSSYPIFNHFLLLIMKCTQPIHHMHLGIVHKLW